MKWKSEKTLFVIIFLSALAILVPVHILLLRITGGFSRIVVLTVGTVFGYGFISLAFYLVVHEIRKCRKAEEFLLDSENRYRMLIKQASDGIIIGDRKGRVTEANQKACELLGYSLHELLLLKRDDLFFPEDRTDRMAKMNGLLAGEVVINERRLRRKDGTAIVVETSSRLFPDGTMQAIMRDITERKQAEEKLRESEIRYRTLIEQASDAIIVGDGTKVVIVNSRACEMFGYTQEEFSTLTMQDLFLPDDYETISDRMETLLKGVAVISDRKLRRKDGKIIVVETSAKLFENGYMQAIVRDITERKQTENALRESEDRYRTLFEQAADAMVLFDAETGEMVKFNDRTNENLGYTREEFQNLHILDIEVNDKSLEDVKHRMEKVILEGSDNFATQHRRKNGEITDIYVSTRSVSLKGKPFIQSIWRDITDLKKAEKELQESKEHFRSLVQTAADIIVCLSPDYKIIEFNAEAERFFGYEREEVIGRDYFEMFVPERVRETVATDIRKAMEGEPTRGSEYTLQISDGRKRVTMWNLNRLIDTKEEMVGVIAVGQDITCRKRAEEKIHRINNLYVVLTKINESIVHIRDPQELYQKACRIAVEDGLFMTAWIGLIDHETSTLKPVAHWGVVDKYFENVVIPLSALVKEGRGPVGTAIREGKPVIRNYFDDSFSELPWHKKAHELGYRSTASFPFRIKDRVIGSLNLYADRSYFFNDDEVQLLETLTKDISFALKSIEEAKAHRKAENLLEQSEERLRMLIECAHDAIITVNSQGSIVAWNQGAETIYGYSAQEVVGKPSTILWPERLKGPHLDGLKRALSKGMIEETRRKAIGMSKDGREIALEGSYVLWKFNGETFVTAIIHDQQP